MVKSADSPGGVGRESESEPKTLNPYVYKVQPTRETRLTTTSGFSPWTIFWVALLGLVSANFMVSVLAAAINELAREFSVDRSLMRWVVTGPNLGFAVLAVTAGKLADLYGRRQAFLVSLIGSGFFGLLSAVAWSAESLIIFRTLSAIFGSATGPAGIAIIFTQFEASKRIRVLGWWGLVMAGGPVAGIAICGPLIDLYSWRWVFIAQVPVTALALILGYKVLPSTSRKTDIKFDIPGTLLLAAGLSALLAAINRGPIWGWGSTSISVLVSISVVLLALFIFQEKRAVAPLIPIEYFRRRNFVIPMLSQVFTNFAYMGAGFVLTPLFIAEVYGHSVTRTSYLITSRPLFFALAGPLVGFAGARLGERVLSVSGAFFVAVSACLLSLANATSGDFFVFVSLGIAGFGLGVMQPAMTSVITNAVEEKDVATAGGAQQMMWQLGTAGGIEILGSIQESREPFSGLVGSYNEAFMIAAGFAFLGVVLVSFVRRV